MTAMCECRVNLAMRFWRDGQQVASLPIDDPADAGPHADVLEALGADHWQVVCPQCEQEYVSGGFLGDDDPVDVLVAPRWNPFRQTRYVSGSSTDFRCSECRRRVVLAPSSVRLQGGRQVRILCIECLPPYVRDTEAQQISVHHLGDEPRD